MNPTTKEEIEKLESEAKGRFRRCSEFKSLKSGKIFKYRGDLYYSEEYECIFSGIRGGGLGYLWWDGKYSTIVEYIKTPEFYY